MKQLLIIAQDKVGLLTKIAKTLAKARVNVDSISAESMGRKAVVRLVVSHPTSAKTMLEKIGLKVQDGDALVARLPNKPGSLAELSDKLSKARVNIESIHLVHKGELEGLFAIKVDKPDKALKILKEYF